MGGRVLYIISRETALEVFWKQSVNSFSLLVSLWNVVQHHLVMLRFRSDATTLVLSVTSLRPPVNFIKSAKTTR